MKRVPSVFGRVMAFLLFASVSPHLAQAEENLLGPEARAAQLRWKRKVQEADVAYIQELEEAKGKAMKAGKLEQANAISSEMKAVRERFVAATRKPAASSTKEPKVEKKAADEGKDVGGEEMTPESFAEWLKVVSLTQEENGRVFTFTQWEVIWTYPKDLEFKHRRSPTIDPEERSISWQTVKKDSNSPVQKIIMKPSLKTGVLYEDDEKIDEIVAKLPN